MHLGAYWRGVAGAILVTTIILALGVPQPRLVLASAKDGLSPTRTYTWHQVTAAAWPARSSHAVVVFQDKLWLFEGVSNSEGGRHTDIWSSTDGMNWTQVMATVPWSPRACRIVTFQDTMWLLGGGTTINDANDVWSSGDGVQWMNMTGGAKWTRRNYYTASALTDRMLVIGGNINDVWSSRDGDTWAQATASIPWIDRWGTRSIVFQDRVWIFGGVHYNTVYGTLDLLDDVWSTPDGIRWTLEVSLVPWHVRGGFGLTVFDNQIWILGGSYETGTGSDSYIQYLNDLWCSTDGSNWIHAPNANWLPRAGHAAVVFHNRLWILGGWTKVDDQTDSLTNDVWYMAPDPGASFRGTPLSGVAPLTVQFTDDSTAEATPITSWNWDFGDGTSSTERNPSHTYSTRGIYTVSLTVTAGDFYNTATEEAYITVSGEQHPFHTADPNQDTRISLSELLRLIQFFNSGGLHCQSGTEDGYAPGQGGNTGCAFYDADYYPPDWTINLTEVLRVIQFFNMHGYHACPDAGTEDGYCPGAR